MGLGKYIKSLLNVNNAASTKSLALFVSAFVSSIIGLCVGFVICYDVVTNGYVKTDLDSLGIFLLCSGGYVLGSGLPKAIVDYKGKGEKVANFISDDEEEEKEKQEV